ncbi:MAG: matrixin family metalloprotease [Pseudomonadales bacterium]|nr:matrixin family metalloprotease [Pseudomonadales bacterium]
MTAFLARPAVGLVSGLLMALLLPLPAAGFNITGSRWDAGETVFNVGITGNAPSGQSWSVAFEDAMARWSQATAFDFLIMRSFLDPCQGFSRNTANNNGFPSGGGDARNGVNFSSSACGNDFGQGVLAVTFSLGSSSSLGFGRISQADIIFNSNINWDIYNGKLRPQMDFGRVALHELGHALGLGHETTRPAIMAPAVSAIDALQVDDIAGANSIYGPPGTCQTPEVSLNTVISGALTEGDCRMFELLNIGIDTSFVDAFRLHLDSEQTLSLQMESGLLDAVVLIVDENLQELGLDDDGAGDCDARLSAIFPAGDFLILANTFDRPTACKGTTGDYRLTISDNPRPLLKRAQSLSGTGSNAIFSGGATGSLQEGFRSQFRADEAVTVSASIRIAPEHVGRAGSLFVLAILDNGQRFVKTATGQFIAFSGNLAQLPAYRPSILLDAQEDIDIIKNLRGRNAGLNGRNFSVFVGYSLSSQPTEIFHHTRPITFSITSQ